MRKTWLGMFSGPRAPLFQDLGWACLAGINVGVTPRCIAKGASPFVDLLASDRTETTCIAPFHSMRSTPHAEIESGTVRDSPGRVRHAFKNQMKNGGRLILIGARPGAERSQRNRPSKGVVISGLLQWRIPKRRRGAECMGSQAMAHSTTTPTPKSSPGRSAIYPQKRGTGIIIVTVTVRR